ncbi:cysteine proteinase [Durotheca rogersii]|uniref:cysteine proteinase n=1 Tax=Durotheca rogersii TaxID=419775 RepID=UPI00221E832C|nr:cysteine proteinase [Durotheca rogersii]KAI5866180.1 cysteine proteinase [Durotheca rogersii]
MGSVAFTRSTATSGVGAQGVVASAMDNNSGIAANGAARHNAGSDSGAGRAPFRHIDDLVSVNVDVDPHAPLRKLLELGDASMRQAMTWYTFGRRDLALMEYIKAFTIAVDKIPRHKDYPSLTSDRGALGRQYNALKQQITTKSADFSKIKIEIQEDNRRSGVRPMSSSRTSLDPAPASRSSAVSAQSRVSSPPNHQGNESKNSFDTPDGSGRAEDARENASGSRKVKPPVQPKPQALHGKAIRQASESVPDDLASRFARLRESQKPGNATKATQPAGTGSVPSLHQRLPSLDSSVPSMPKLPDAIYSPARGTITSEVANLPSSTPRGMFSRTNSITSTPSASARISTEIAIRAFSNEQFVAAHAYGASLPSMTPAGVRIPSGETITARALADLLNRASPKVEVLIIDVRSRESFDKGHIPSDKTICVEPEILTRENVSAEQIADSMVLAPSNERLAIEQRDKVDLVVIYDGDSTSIPTRITGDSAEMILYNVRQALSYYSYSRPLKTNPKLLTGGLNAWVDEFGGHSLAVSDTLTDPSPRTGDKRRLRAKPLNQDEINQFEETIKEDQTGASTFDYIKTREDFVRRYPSVTGIPESMTGPVREEHVQSGHIPDSTEDFLAGISPAPPRRPAPAMARTRYSGLESRDSDTDVGSVATQGSASSLWQSRTGLQNPQNWCYANSTIQIFLSSSGFADEMVRSDWPDRWRISADRRPNRPQLMAKILGNLLQWMNKRQFEVMRATTFMHYLRSIHTGYVGDRGRVIRLGDDNQQDAEEFTNFVFDQLAAETDMSSSLSSSPAPVVPAEASLLVSFVIKDWWRISVSSSSMIDHYWRVFEVNERVCDSCGEVGFFPENTHGTFVSPPARRRDVQTPLEKLLEDQQWTSNANIQVTCEKCQSTRHQRWTRLARIPPLFRVVIRRSVPTMTGGMVKRMDPISFPIDDFDVSPYSLAEEVRSQAAAALGPEHNDGFLGPRMYDLYGIQCHYGATTQSGHYWCWVRVGRDAWLKCEDHNVSYYCGDIWRRERNAMFNCDGNVTPVQLFYKRRDIPWRWDPR